MLPQQGSDHLGRYPNIPDYIKKIIDQELIALGRYAKRINLPAIEKGIETGTVPAGISIQFENSTSA